MKHTDQIMQLRAMLKQTVDALRDGTRVCNNLCNTHMHDIDRLIDVAEAAQNVVSPCIYDRGWCYAHQHKKPCPVGELDRVLKEL